MSTAQDTAGDALDGETARPAILAATARLIATGGRDAATTRAIAAAAGVQGPTIYRLFGDKRGLLDAVAEAGLAAYVAEKSARTPHPDPVEDLRQGWDNYIAFGLAHPGLFAIMTTDHPTLPPSPAAMAGLEVLRRQVRSIASKGRLATSQERAVDLIHAMGVGTVLSLLAQPEPGRDPGLSTAAREAVIAAITGAAPSGRADVAPRQTAAALSACLDRTDVLSAGERLFLDELLTRIAVGG